MRAAVLAAALACAGCASAPPAPRAADTYADYLVGYIANARDDYAAAADRYFAALARSPQDQALVEGALRASLALGDAERARRAARLGGDEDAPALAHLVRAADALRIDDWRRAQREAGRVEGVAAEELLARILLLWSNAGRERLDAVLVQLEPLASVRPYGGLFAYQQGMALDAAGRGDEALAAYEVAARSGWPLPSGVARHAQFLLRADRREEAAGVLRTALVSQADPFLAAALVRVEAGGAVVDGALTPAQGAAAGVYGMGVIFLQERDLQNAFAALTLALMLDPDLDPARLAFARAQADLGRVDAARAEFAAIPATSPYAENARLLTAWTLFDAGREQDALAAARAAADAGDVRARRTLADMYAQLEQYAAAEPLYAELIGAEPENWQLYFARAAARDRLDRWPEAEADLRRALELSPQQPDVLNYLGYSWIDRGERLREGLAMIERALALRPDSAAILDSLGWAHYRLGAFDEAVLHLERAVERAPADPTLNDHLGDAYWRLGRRIEARFQWRRALGLDPENGAAIEAKLANGLAPPRAVRR